MSLESSPRIELRLVLVLGGLSAFGPLSLDMYLPGLPALAKDLLVSPAQAQLTLTACLVGVALGQLVVGSLSDMLGRRRPLLAGLTAYTVASLACALTPSIQALITARFLQGAAGGAGIVIARAVARDLYSGIPLARFFALLMLVNGAAPVLAPIIGGQLLVLWSWRACFLVLAAIGALLLLAAAASLPESLPPDRRRPGGLSQTLRTFRRLLAHRAFLGYALCCALAIGGLFTYISGSPFVLEGIYSVSAQGFSLAFAANAVGIMLAGQLSARVVGRIGPARLLAGGLVTGLLGALGLLTAVLAHASLAGVLVSLFVLVASVGLVLPNATALAMADQASVAGSAAALLGLIQFAVGALVAPLAGVAGPRTAVPMAVVITALGTAAVLSFAMARRASTVS